VDGTAEGESRQRNVLVADDDRDIRELVAAKLRNAGYHVSVVGDGLSALSAINDEPPDVAVLDVMMPGLSGLDIVGQVRANGEHDSMGIILLTAKSQEFDVESGFAVGADDYVIKPFSPRELVHRVNAVAARLRG